MDFTSFFPDFSSGIPSGQAVEAWFWIIPLVASAIGAAAQARANKKQREANMELAKYQFEQNQLQINRQNLYNSPESQMQRYKDAGLNPNLIYGSGASAGNQSSTASYERPEQRYQSAIQGNMPDIPSMLTAYQDFRMRNAQIDNVRAQTENTHQRTMTEAVTRYLRDVQGRKTRQDLSQSQILAPYQQEILKGQASAAEVKALQEFQRLRNMTQQEQLSLLDQQYRQKGIEGQAVEVERKKAQLLFEQYRNQWMQMGITGSDNPILRILVRMMAESGITPEAVFKK